MTRLICLPVITARAGNLSLHIFQNYHENISRFQKRQSLILIYALSVNRQSLSGTDLRVTQNVGKQNKLNIPKTYITRMIKKHLVQNAFYTCTLSYFYLHIVNFLGFEEKGWKNQST